MGVPLAIGAVAALAALGTRRGSRSAPLPDWLSPLDARVVVEDGRPHWLFELPFISPRRLGGTVRVLFPMAGGDPLPPRGLVAQWGERVDPQAIADARRLLEGHQQWSTHLIELPIDWNREIYGRFGRWGASSKCFLRQESEEATHGRDAGHERRFESGVSVLSVEPRLTGWQLQRPSQSQAIYKLPYGYLSDMKKSRQGEPFFIVQGDRVVIGEHVDEYTGDVFDVPAFGADGEPLLGGGTIQVVSEPDRSKVL